MAQPFKDEPLGLRDLTLWKRNCVDIMVDMLEDPDYCADMDWSGVPSADPGVYNSLTSGDWYRETKVSQRSVTSYNVL